MRAQLIEFSLSIVTLARSRFGWLLGQTDIIEWSQVHISLLHLAVIHLSVRTTYNVRMYVRAAFNLKL